MHASLCLSILISIFLNNTNAQSTTLQTSIVSGPSSTAATSTAAGSTASVAVPSASTAASKYLPWAAFGDSWASGVKYDNFGGADLAYDAGDDNEANRCLRIVDAYSVLLKNDADISWTNGRIPFLHFQACSGSKFDGIGDQISRIVSDSDDEIPKLATITIGGNNAGFFDVVSACIYQQDDIKDYGPAYPDKAGDCAIAIQACKDRVASDDFKNNFWGAVQSISTKFSDDENFRVFVTGYARFFEAETDPCDKWTFSPSYLTNHAPKVTKALRSAMNDLVTSINTMYADTIKDKSDPRIHFVDIDPAFEGSRFCEFNDGTQRQQQLHSAFFTFDYNEHDSTKPALTCDPDMDGCAINGTSYVTTNLLTQSGGGSIARNFHPKMGGHSFIEGKIKEAIKDGFEG